MILTFFNIFCTWDVIYLHRPTYIKDDKKHPWTK